MSKTVFKVSAGNDAKIERREALKVTEHYVFFAADDFSSARQRKKRTRRVQRHSHWENYFLSFEEARASLLRRLVNQIEKSRETLNRAQANREYLNRRELEGDYFRDNEN